MHDNETNPFPDDSLILAWYPPLGAEDQDRNVWAWLPSSIINRVDPDEWYVAVEAPEFVEPDPDIPNGDAPENLIYTACFRDTSELRPVTTLVWNAIREAFSCD